MKCQCSEQGKRPPPEFEWMFDPVNELPYTGHEPHECQCTYKLGPYRVIATGEVVLLCNCCHTEQHEMVLQ